MKFTAVGSHPGEGNHPVERIGEGGRSSSATLGRMDTLGMVAIQGWEVWSTLTCSLGLWWVGGHLHGLCSMDRWWSLLNISAGRWVGLWIGSLWVGRLLWASWDDGGSGR